jgi:endonuclease/exonuclease/phosphatase (EEP) superfamily protein YafD
MKEYSFVTYNIFKAHFPFVRQNIGKFCAHHDFIALQEWVSNLHVRDDEYLTSCTTFTVPFRNIETGTATISRHKPIDVLKLTTREKELGVMTHKSMLITAYTLHDGTTLHIANIHSLNFVTNTIWKKQIDYCIEHLPTTGPLIFAGDFNTWNPARFNYLEKKLQEHHLHYANYDHSIIMRLDHIFTRGIEVLDTIEDINMHTSDHYPVIMKFRVEHSL